MPGARALSRLVLETVKLCHVACPVHVLRSEVGEAFGDQESIKDEGGGLFW